MEGIKLLHMNGGTGDASYAKNSLVQQQAIVIAKPITEEAIRDLFCSLYPEPETLKIADLGCSSGQNTLLLMSHLIKAICKAKSSRPMSHNSSGTHIFFNDLPGNDFNLIFRSLQSFQERLREELGSDLGPCFYNGTPGSFYDRLFPAHTLHFVHSSYSLHWLSQVPKGAEKNKDNIYLARTSPECVVEAYSQQFQKDFSRFLRCRSTEVVAGGFMVLTILGRISEDPCSKEGCLIWELLAKALQDMVSKGLIQEEKLHSFNIPHYTPCLEEVKALIKEEGSFEIVSQEASSFNWDIYNTSSSSPSNNGTKDGASNLTMTMRAIAEPLLLEHFDADIIDEVFFKYGENISDCMSRGEQQSINVSVSMKKKMLS